MVENMLKVNHTYPELYTERAVLVEGFLDFKIKIFSTIFHTKC